MGNKRALAALALLIFAVSLWAGVTGLNFGRHWDENTSVDDVRASFRTHVFLPRDCRYTSLLYDVGLVVGGVVGESRESGSFYLAYRFACLVLSLLAIAWCGGLAWELTGGSRLGTATALVVLGGSWEFNYHARWIAPDALAASLACLCFYLLARGNRRRSFATLAWAAVVAGLAFGTKQSLVVLVLPVLVTGFFVSARRRRARELAALVGLWVVAFLVTTPAVILRTEAVRQGLALQLHIYGVQGHRGHTVAPGLQHFGLILEYLGLAAFSRYALISLLLLGLCVAGGALALRESWRRQALFPGLVAAFALAYLVSFSSLRVLIVRNLLPVLPLLAALSALAAAQLERRRAALRRPATLFALALALVLAVNLGWQLEAARSVARQQGPQAIRTIDPADFPPGKTIWASSSFRISPDSGIVLAPPDKADLVLFQSGDFKDWLQAREHLLANRPGTYHLLSSGPYDVNFDYYPNWEGSIRPVWVTREFAERSGLLSWLR